MATVKKFTTDCNINEIHYNVLKSFDEDAKQVELIDQNIDELEGVIEDAVSKLEIKVAEKRKEELLKVRERYASGARRKEYYGLVKNYIDEYKRLEGIRSGNVSDGVNIRDVTEYRIEVIRKYLEIANRYCTVNVVWQPDTGEEMCGVCDRSLVGGVCPGCGASSLIEDEISIEKSGQYDAVANFMKFVTCAMGEQAAAAIDGVMRDMDDAAKKLKMIQSEEIRAMEPDAYGHRGPYDMRQFMALMAAAGHSSRNKDKHLIIKAYWGWELYNVHHFLHVIREDCIRIHTEYKKVKRSEKISSINREYLYYKILQWHRDKLGRPLTEKHFDIITTDRILSDYENDMKEICKRLDDKDRPYIPLRGGKTLVKKTAMATTEYSAKFKKNSTTVTKSLVALLKGFRDQGHIEIDDVELDFVVEYVGDQTELDSITKFASKFFGGSQQQVETKVNSVIKRDDSYFKENVTGILPNSSDTDADSNLSAVVKIVKPLVDRFAYLITANTKKKDEDGNPIPLITKETKDKFWNFIDALLRDAIEHFATTGQTIEGIDMAVITKVARPTFQVYLAKKAVSAKATGKK